MRCNMDVSTIIGFNDIELSWAESLFSLISLLLLCELSLYYLEYYIISM